MKTIAMLILLALSSDALANDICPNLNGVFQVDDITAVRFTQNECKSLSEAWGTIQENGEIEWYKPEMIKLNGPATCNAYGCVTATTTAEQVEMSRDNDWVHENAEHGVCAFNQVNYSIDGQGNLLGKHNVFDCSDGFVGWTDIVFPRLN